MNDDETKRLIATLIQVVDRANARITGLEQLIIAEAEAMAGLTARLDEQARRLDEQDERFNEAMASLKERLDRHHNRIHALALHVDDHNNTYTDGLELRLTAIEQRLAALEPQGDPDDVTRDALHALDELDELNAYWAGRAMDARLQLRKLNNFPPTEGNE